jgi:hypothetical protein
MFNCFHYSEIKPSTFSDLALITGLAPSRPAATPVNLRKKIAPDCAIPLLRGVEGCVSVFTGHPHNTPLPPLFPPRPLSRGDFRFFLSISKLKLTAMGPATGTFCSAFCLEFSAKAFTSSRYSSNNQPYSTRSHNRANIAYNRINLPGYTGITLSHQST